MGKEIHPTKAKVDPLTTEMVYVTSSKDGLHKNVDDLFTNLDDKKAALASNMEVLIKTITKLQGKQK